MIKVDERKSVVINFGEDYIADTFFKGGGEVVVACRSPDEEVKIVFPNFDAYDYFVAKLKLKNEQQSMRMRRKNYYEKKLLVEKGDLVL